MTTFNYNPHDFNADLIEGFASEYFEWCRSLEPDEAEMDARLCEMAEDEGLPF